MLVGDIAGMENCGMMVGELVLGGGTGCGTWSSVSFGMICGLLCVYSGVT